MNNEHPDRFTMIGLHKLASHCGDGLVPELYELLSSRSRIIDDNPNVTEFPAWQARPPARPALGLAPEPRDNIVRFPAGAAGVARAKDQS